MTTSNVTISSLTGARDPLMADLELAQKEEKAKSECHFASLSKKRNALFPSTNVTGNLDITI